MKGLKQSKLKYVHINSGQKTQCVQIYYIRKIEKVQGWYSQSTLSEILSLTSNDEQTIYHLVLQIHNYVQLGNSFKLM